MSNSVRFHRLGGLHPVEEETPEGPARAGLPASCDDSGGEAEPACPSGRLWREGDMVMFAADGIEPVPVRILWARPLTGRGGPVSIMKAGKKKEVAYLPSLDALPPESRRVALEELAGGMILARITAIRSVKPRFGNYYWNVETDRGDRRFLLTSPENNSLRPSPDTIVVRDTAGNCYEISPVSGLDGNSLRELDRVL